MLGAWDMVVIMAAFINLWGKRTSEEVRTVRKTKCYNKGDKGMSS